MNKNQGSNKKYINSKKEQQQGFRRPSDAEEPWWYTLDRAMKHKWDTHQTQDYFAYPEPESKVSPPYDLLDVLSKFSRPR